MRRVLLLVAGTATCGVVVAACSGGGGKGGLKGNGELSSGTYVISNFATVADDCNLGLDPSTANGATFDITVSGNTLSFQLGASDQATGPYNAGVFDAKFKGDIDFSPNYDCVLTEEYEFAGASTATDAADATETIKASVKSGAGCAQLQQDAGIASLPCTSKDTQHIAKQPPPQNVTATLVTATGYGTTLSNDYLSDNTASTLTANITQGSLNFSLPAGENFQCYSPTATGAGYYELGTYEVSVAPLMLLHVTSSAWVAGSVALDGSNNTLQVDLVDGNGNELVAQATGGSIMLGAAPTTTTGACSFGAANVPMSGTLQPAAFVGSHPRPTLDLAGQPVLFKGKKSPKHRAAH